MTKQRQTKYPELNAEPGEPWIGVHTLSEFEFCPRAGICSHDLAENDDGEELNDRPGFYHLPIFFKEELDRRQTELAEASLLSVGFGLVTLVCMVAAAFFLHPVFYVAAMLCGTASLVAFATLRVRTMAVRRVVHEWDDANSEVPNVDISEPTVAHWPNFFVAGYKPEKPQDVMREDKWKLAGKPWRVLHHGNRVIPVFLRNVTDGCAAVSDDAETPQLYAQHFVRIAAYCNLVEASDGRQSPYGIVLTRGTLTGIAIPNTKATREQFVAAMANARNVMRDVGRQPRMRPVSDEKLCKRCPHGRPVTLDVCFLPRVTDEDQKPMELIPHLAIAKPHGNQENRQERPYHSHCGDRFGSLPPHEKAIQLELKEIIG